MPVLIVELRDNYVGICADCCRTNIETGDKMKMYIIKSRRYQIPYR